MLVRLDLDTGAATVIGDTGLTKVGSIEFGPDGELYGGLTDIAPELATYLVRIDLETAAVTPVGATGYSITGLTGCAPPKGEDDADGDGVANADDSCPQSDTSPSIVIRDCETFVVNPLQEDGCTVSDEIQRCEALGLPGFTPCTLNVAKEAVHAGLIIQAERRRIATCVRLVVPRPHIQPKRAKLHGSR
jgi:hypothetical protein